MNNTVVSAKNAWYQKWFDSSFYHLLYSNRDEHEAAAFISMLLNELQPEDNSPMLDLGCGAGRHAKHLALHGHRVTGLNLSTSSIRMAKKIPVSGLEFYEHDMRQPFGTARFDYVFNFFTSFGYFKDAGDNHKVVQNMYAALKPGGTVVLDYLNVNYSEEHSTPFETKEIDGVIYNISRWNDETHFYKKVSIENFELTVPAEYMEQVEKLRLEDFELMFSLNRLKMIKVYGDYHLNKYDENRSPRMIMVAEKR